MKKFNFYHKQKKTPTPETIVKEQIKSYLNKLGIFWWWNFETYWCRKGLSDIMAMHDGKFYAIEIKAPERIDHKGKRKPKGKCSPEQLEFLSKIQAAGGIAIIAFDVEDIRRYFEKYQPRDLFNYRRKENEEKTNQEN